MKEHRSRTVTKDRPYARATRRQEAKKRVLLVDDHPVIRLGLAEIINREPDMEVCGETEDPREMLEMIRGSKPDVVSVDLTLGEYDGIKLIETIRSLHPELAILVFSMHEDAIFEWKALQAGARAYVKKRDGSDKMVATIRDLFKRS